MCGYFCSVTFQKKEVEFCVWLDLSSGRLGAVLNINLSGQLYSSLTVITNNNARLGCVFLLGFALIMLGVAVGLVAVMLDYRRD